MKYLSTVAATTSTLAKSKSCLRIYHCVNSVYDYYLTSVHTLKKLGLILLHWYGKSSSKI